MKNGKKLITCLELNGQRIETDDDLKAVFDVEYFISKRKAISNWLKNNCPKFEKKIPSSAETDDEWIRELAKVLGCPEKYQEYISAQKEPDRKETASSMSTDEPKDITPSPSSPKTTQVKVSSASELREVLEQGCDEIQAIGYFSECVYELLGKDIDSSEKELIRKCEAYLNSPETEEDSLKDVMASLGLNGSSENDEDFFGIIYYRRISNYIRAEIILTTLVGLMRRGDYFGRIDDDKYDLARCYLKLLDFDIKSFTKRGKSRNLLLTKKADNSTKRYANIFKKCCLTCNRLVIQRDIEVNDLGTCIAYTGTGMCDIPTGYCGATSGPCYYYEIWSKLDWKIKEMQ